MAALLVGIVGALYGRAPDRPRISVRPQAAAAKRSGPPRPN